MTSVELVQDEYAGDENTRVVKRLFDEVWNRHETHALDEILAADHKLQVGSERFDGIEAFRKIVTMWRDAFPDMKFHIENIVAQNGHVAVRWAARGTHLNAFIGIAPTKKQVNFWGMNLIIVRDGRIVHQWGTADWEDLFAALTNRKSYSLNPLTKRVA